MAAISVPSSYHWDGSDGLWSTFAIQIGTPPQTISVLPATSKSNVWVVMPGYCPSLSGVGNCASFRGGLTGLFTPENSTTFNGIQLSDKVPYFELTFYGEELLGYEGNGSYGTDVVGLIGGSSDGNISDQLVSAFAYTTPFLATGLLGLSDESVNVTSYMDSYQSLLSNLYTSGTIPSLLWAYNAGAQYLSSTVFGSLTLGGYDSGRGGGNLEDALTIPLQANQFRDLVVSIPRISFGEEPAATTSTFTAYIDSVVPELWLPPDACKAFEDHFDLQWNDTAQMYLLGVESQEKLSSSTETVKMTLADPGNSSNSRVLEVPYAAFNLEARYPTTGTPNGSAVHYFPLKPANSSTGAYLGRTFLQAAYLAVDYKKAQLYLSQADMSASSLIVTVYAEQSDDGGAGLSKGAIAGIAVCVVVIAMVVASLIAWFVCRPRWKKRRNAQFRARVEAENAGLPSSQVQNEMQEDGSKRLMSSETGYRQELDATTTARGRYKQELDATDTARGTRSTRAELEARSRYSLRSLRGLRSVRRQHHGNASSPAELQSRSSRRAQEIDPSSDDSEATAQLNDPERRHAEQAANLHEMP